MGSWEEAWKKIFGKEQVGLTDMTELREVNDHSIAENLKLRLKNEDIYVSLLACSVYVGDPDLRYSNQGQIGFSSSIYI